MTPPLLESPDDRLKETCSASEYPHAFLDFLRSQLGHELYMFAVMPNYTYFQADLFIKQRVTVNGQI